MALEEFTGFFVHNSRDLLVASMVSGRKQHMTELKMKYCEIDT